MANSARLSSTAVLLFTVCFCISACHKFDIEKKLHRQLLDNYDRFFFPISIDQPLPVEVSLDLRRITTFDEVEETLETTGHFKFRWTDIRLAWNPEMFNDLNKTVFHQKEIWVPEIAVDNSVKGFRVFGDPELFLQVESTGLVHWEPMVQLETECTLLTKYFPFDQQTCTIAIVPGLCSSDRVSLINNGFSVAPMKRNGHWKMVSSVVETFPSYKSGLHFNISVRRRSSYYMITVLLPIFAVSVLTCFSFLIPRNSDEKISYSVTVFLAYLVLMSFIQDKLPRTSTEQPALVLHIGMMMLFALVSVIWSVIAALVSQRHSIKGTYRKPDRGFNEERSVSENNLHDGVQIIEDFIQNFKRLVDICNDMFKKMLISKRTLESDEKEIGTAEQRTVKNEDRKKFAGKTKEFMKYEPFWRRVLFSKIVKYIDLIMFLVATLVTCMLTLYTILTLIGNH